MADKNVDNVLSLKEIIGLLKHLNIECDFDTAKRMFQVSLLYSPRIQYILTSQGSLCCGTHLTKP